MDGTGARVDADGKFTVFEDGRESVIEQLSPSVVAELSQKIQATTPGIISIPDFTCFDDPEKTFGIVTDQGQKVALMFQKCGRRFFMDTMNSASQFLVNFLEPRSNQALKVIYNWHCSKENR